MAKSEKELKAKADKVFAVNAADTLHCTSDGQCFVSENRAMLHARDAGKDGKPLKVTAFKREAQGPPAPKGGETSLDSAREDKADFEIRAEKVAKADTIEAVKELLEGETAKTVQKAGAKRIKELELLNHGDTGKGSKESGVGSKESGVGSKGPADPGTKTGASETKTGGSEESTETANTAKQ